MAITQANVDAANATLAEVAARGAQSVASGDKRVEYIDPIKLRELTKSLEEEVNGGMYSMAPTQKGYF